MIRIGLIIALLVTSVYAEDGWITSSNRTVWQQGHEVALAFHHAEGPHKPYLHPIRLPSGVVLTDERPSDHPWHYGLWWSWKYINRLNFWEEDRTTRKSEGETVLRSTRFTSTADQSGLFEQHLTYGQPGGPVWVDEERRVRITAPSTNGYRIDWESTFTMREHVLLDRTPPRASPGKGGSGGYAGLALRLGRPMRDWTYRAGGLDERNAELNGFAAPWLAGAGEGGAFLFLDHPGNPGSPVRWRMTPDMPYVAPSPLHAAPLNQPKGSTLRFRYRLLILPAAPDPAACAAAYQAFAEH